MSQSVLFPGRVSQKLGNNHRSALFLGFCTGSELQSSFDSTLENGALGLTQSSMLSPQQAQDQVLYRERPRSPFHSRYAWIIGAFVLSRVLYFWAGIRFDTHILVSNFQFIDLPLLRTLLFESLFCFYMQPPPMYLLVGTAIKAFPDDYAALHALCLASGLNSAILLYIIMPRLGVNAAWISNLYHLFFHSAVCCGRVLLTETQEHGLRGSSHPCRYGPGVVLQEADGSWTILQQLVVWPITLSQL
jgi:hypothetical protein